MRTNQYIGGDPTGASAPPEPIGLHEDVTIICDVVVELKKETEERGEVSRAEVIEELSNLFDEPCSGFDCDVAVASTGWLKRKCSWRGVVRLVLSWTGSYDYSRESTEDRRITARALEAMPVDALKRQGWKVSTEVAYEIE